ncbi:hypothetical protein HY622_01570 [Candidatus Uhrbacteria bacterium]|nr:hypothetical protein [Candidatus Uhrbacteria bacterium]
MRYEEERRSVPEIRPLERTLNLQLPVSHRIISSTEPLGIDYDAVEQCHCLKIPAFMLDNPHDHFGDISQMLCFFKLFEEVDPNFAYPYFPQIHQQAEGNVKKVLDERKGKFLHAWHLLAMIWSSDIQIKHWRQYFLEQQEDCLRFLDAIAEKGDEQMQKSNAVVFALIRYLVRQDRYGLPLDKGGILRALYPAPINGAIDQIVEGCKGIPRISSKPILARLTLERWALELCHAFGFNVVPHLRFESGIYVWVLLDKKSLRYGAPPGSQGTW